MSVLALVSVLYIDARADAAHQKEILYTELFGFTQAMISEERRAQADASLAPLIAQETSNRYRQMSERLTLLRSTGVDAAQMTRQQVVLDRYHGAVQELYRLFESGDLASARAWDDANVDPAHNDLIAEIDRAANAAKSERQGAEFAADAGVAGTIAIATGLIGLLVWKGAQIQGQMSRAAGERAAMVRSEAHFRTLLHHSSDIVSVFDAAGRRTYVSPSVESQLGFRESDLMQGGAQIVTHPDDLQEHATFMAAVKNESGRSRPAEFRVQHADGSWVPLEVVGENLLDDPNVAGIVFNARNISERRKAEEATRETEARYRALVQNTSDIVMVIRTDGTISYVGPAVQRVLGWTRQDLDGEGILEIVHPADRRSAEERLARAASRFGVVTPFELRVMHRNGSSRWFEVIANIQLENPAVDGIIINARDITERKRLDEELRRVAMHDHLTSLPNRALFLNRLEVALARSDQAQQLAILFLNLDGFKEVNDRFGHFAGDRLLIEVANRLTAVIRSDDTVARFGGDEFAVLVQPDVDEESVHSIAERILASLSVPFAIEGLPVTVGASIGIVRGGPATNDGIDLLRMADAALYRAKQSGKNTFVFDGSKHSDVPRDLSKHLLAGDALNRGSGAPPEAVKASPA